MLDELDRKLILELQKDGRYTYSDLSRKVGISVSAARRRVQRLTKESIIRITAVLDPTRIGYGTSAIIALNVDLIKIDTVCATLVEYGNVDLVAIAFGRFDVLIRVHFFDSVMVTNFIKDVIAHIDGVTAVETFLIADWKKLEPASLITNPENLGRLPVK